MKMGKLASSIIFFFAMSSCMMLLQPMELTPSSDNLFNMSSPSQLLQSIKILQKQGKTPENIAQALNQALKSKDMNLNFITSRLSTANEVFDGYANILYFLDETCDRNTVSIILSSFNKEQDACTFIIYCDGCPSGLERMLIKNYDECAVPMIKLLCKNKIKIFLARRRFLVGLDIETIDIDAMFTKTRKKLETPRSFFCCKKFVLDQEISDERVLLEVIKELKKLLNTDHSDPEGWLGYFTYRPLTENGL